jgi:hypothetical protein
MKRSSIAVCAVAVGVLLLIGQPAAAQITFTPLFQDGFETYNRGSLDKNDVFGTNQDNNGVGNPWFGPGPPNQQVVGTQHMIMPHSGTQMAGGEDLGTVSFDQSWYNLAYRLNNGQPYTGLILFDFWFYDTGGPGNANYQDYAALGYYNTAPANTDGPIYGDSHDYSLNFNVDGNTIQRLSLGASSVQDGLFDPNYYQARVVGASGGYNANGDWFNLPLARTVGWHHGGIAVGPLQPNGTSTAHFYIDDPTTPLLVLPVPAARNQYNVLELNNNFGTVTGYYDDLTFSLINLP